MWGFFVVCNRSKSSSLSLNVPWESCYYVFICPSYVFNFLSMFLNLLGHPNQYKIMLSLEELTGRGSKPFGNSVLGVCGAGGFLPSLSSSLFLITFLYICWEVKESVCKAGNLGLIPGLGRFSGKGHSILAWRIPWTEEPGSGVEGLQSVRSQRAGHDWATNNFIFSAYKGMLSRPQARQALYQFTRWIPCDCVFSSVLKDHYKLGKPMGLGFPATAKPAVRSRGNLQIKTSSIMFSRDVVCESLSRVQLFATPWTVTHQAPLSMGLSRQQYWSGLPFPSPSRDVGVLKFFFFFFLREYLYLVCSPIQTGCF